MACLVPQFKCPATSPDSHSRSFHHGLHLNAGIFVHFQMQCTSSPMIAVLEKPQIASFDDHSFSLTCINPLAYVGVIGPPEKKTLEGILSRETLLTSEEAVIAAAAAEATALAKAAVEASEEAVQLLESKPSLKVEKSNDYSLNDESLKADFLKQMELEMISISSIPNKIETELDEGGVKLDESQDSIISNVMSHELKLWEKLTVRSKRQKERQARREKAVVDNNAGKFVSVKSGSSGKKKRAVLQGIDYSDPLRYLRATTSTAKLLTTFEEQKLSEGIQDLLKLERTQEELAERMGKQPTFAQWAAAAGLDKKALRKRLIYGMQCKDKMIKSNIRFVISIAKNFVVAGMCIQDLVQEGCRGLLRGVEKFDASKGFKFSTYAHWWIKQAIRKSLSDRSRTIRLPFHMVEATYKVREARKQLYNEHGRHPANEEVAEAAGLSMKRLEAVLLTPKAPTSLDQKIGINQSLKPSEVIADPEALTSEEILMRQFMKEDLNKVLDSLSPREKQILKWRFGLEDGRMKTLQEIGETVGVSRERIRQIETCAFRKLRNKTRTKNLQQYLYL
ncbi:RNA polymerase sigma factor sigB [Apostasia shenzhenica]|uniref:RNA polymerase sigma factor n=1 Tax=Apostasia shenzhenica TaxID=1088818 RepID=A0A2I0B460_9ASPA|nr:RNA polymerase sigma factor sigB [Apostasia shenzhenica]